MPKLRIDVRTRMLPSDPSVYLVRPGARYHHYSTILKHSALPIDVPALQVIDGRGVPEAGKTPLQFARARALRRWSMEPQKSRGARPTMELERYSTFLSEWTEKAQRTKLRNAAQEILWTIPDRSLIMIPASTLSGKAILAEISDRRAPRLTVTGRKKYGALEYTARRLHNLRMVEMRNLPSEVTDEARKQISSQMIEGYAEERLLRAYYGDYQVGTNAMVAGFMAQADDFDARTVAQFIGLTLSIEHYIKTNQYVPPNEMIFGQAHTGQLNFHASVNSPNGSVHVETQTNAPQIFKALAVVAASLIPVGVASQALTSDHIIVENSSEANGDPLINATQNTLVHYARAAGATDMNEIIDNLRYSLTLVEGQVNGTATQE